MSGRAPVMWNRGLAGFVWLMISTSAMAQITDEVEYIHTDALGSPVATTNAAGAVIERQMYEPYGAPISHGPADRPGFTGHMEDSATGLTYMQQRYYDPGIGRFLSVDPVTPSGQRNFNRYSYAADNPYGFTDPDGRDCKSKGGTTTCSFTATGSRIPTKFSFETPKGWPGSIGLGQKNYHSYDKIVSAGEGSAKNADSIRNAVVKDPTPGLGDTPALPQGAMNNATPGNGCCKLFSVDSPVKTYLRADANGNAMVVNVTLPGHPLFPGYVARLVTVENGAAVVHNFGEGTGWLQSQESTLRANFADAMFNNVWYPHSEQNIKDGR
ncbi:RHS repeat domain-containing protein [[Pseudomonas] boreopolis]|uniref:RHS repeat domain-containing protein n=1 Tax=Xanthomonas boreopolis TaxID=86183 RepID=UPI003DA19BCA